MNTTTTNIFCIIANAGSDQELYLKYILNDRVFIKHSKLSRLIYNTTKPENNEEDKGHNKYKYYTTEQYNTIDSDNVVESRSYYTLLYDTVYYFTLNSDIENKNNLICIASPYQYENYKRWISIENMKSPDRYHIYAILIHCPLKDRVQNKLNSSNADNEKEIVEFCRRVLQDNAEFNDAKARIPELNDPMNCDNVCYINNDRSIENDFKINISQIKGFILDKVKIDHPGRQ